MYKCTLLLAGTQDGEVSVTFLLGTVFLPSCGFVASELKQLAKLMPIKEKCPKRLLRRNTIFSNHELVYRVNCDMNAFSVRRIFDYTMAKRSRTLSIGSIY